MPNLEHLHVPVTREGAVLRDRCSSMARCGRACKKRLPINDKVGLIPRTHPIASGAQPEVMHFATTPEYHAIGRDCFVAFVGITRCDQTRELTFAGSA